VRERIGLVALTTLLALLGAALYLATAEKTYEAQAELLVTPIAEEDPALTGLALIRASSDPTRDVETVARLVTSRDVAERVKTQLKLDDSSGEIADKIDAAPVAQSNVVAITAKADDPKRAAELANAVAESAIADRSEKLRAQVTPLIESVRQRIANGEQTADEGTLSDQLARLTSLETTGDPTIRFETRSAEPDSPVSPRPVLTLLAGLFGGLVLGIGGAFVMQAIDPRLRREEQLRELYGLPILARIPRERQGGDSTSRLGGLLPERHPDRRADRHPPLGPSDLSPRTLEAYRTLRTMLSAALGDSEEEAGRGRAVMITGPSPAEGKTTTAINLASSYALAGKRVILLEGDFRRPTVAKALQVQPRVGIGKVLLGEVRLEEALVPVRPFGNDLRLLPVERPDSHLSEILSLPAARNLLDRARQLADYVIIDSPPLTEVVDALPLARYADDVLLVCRLGMSSLQQLSRLADLLEQNTIEPRGFVVVGVGSSDEQSYYLDGHSSVAPDLEHVEQPKDGARAKGSREQRKGARSKGNAQQPKRRVEQPRVGAEQPRGSGQQPRGSGQRPKGSGEQPKGSGEQPKGSGEQPRGNAEQPKGSARPAKGQRLPQR
jgi:capsular exopolysaccharide synthesis family protein